MPDRRASSSSSSRSRVGPPPLRRKEEPKPVKRQKFQWKNVIRVMRGFSIGALRRDLSHLLVYGLFIFVLIFGLGALFSFGGAPEAENGASGETFPVIASVGGTKLARVEFEQTLDGYGLRRGGQVAYLHEQIGQVYDSWVQEQVLRAEAKRRGIGISGGEVEAKIEEQVQLQLESQRGGMSDKKWRYRLQEQGTSAEQVAAELRAELEAKRAEIETAVLLDKVIESIKAEVAIDDDDMKAEYEEVKARAMVVRSETRKPLPPAEGMTESDEERQQRMEQESRWQQDLQAVRAKAEQLLARVKAAPDQFETIARTESDDYTAENGGDLGSFTRARARFGEAFKEAVFALEPGQVSELIEGDEGWVIALVEEKKVWPDDFKTADPRTFDEAKKIADDLAAQLKGGADFAALAKAHSEDPGSKDNGGEYELTGRGMWVKPFEQVAFGLEVDELSPPVRTQFGWHLIQCLERQLYADGATPPEEPELDPESDDAKLLADLPALRNPAIEPAEQVKVRHILIAAEDPEQKVEQMREQLEQTKQNEHVQKVLDELVEKAYDDGRIKVFDPQIKAYLAGKKSDAEAEQYWLQRAARAWPDSHPEVHFQLAQALQRTNAFGVDTKPQVAAAEALGRIGGPQAEQALIESLDTFYPDVKIATIKALAAMKATGAVDRLRQLEASEMDDSVKAAITEALKSLGAPTEGGPAEAPVGESEKVSE